MRIGEIIEALMTERGWSLEETAQQVRAQGATNVRYQHLQQLRDFPDRRPRYLPELAAAFGMTVEDFLDWAPGKANMVRESDAPRYSRHQSGQGGYLRPITIWNDASELPPDQYVFLRRLDYSLSCGNGNVDPGDVEEFDAGAGFRAEYAARKGWKQATHFTMRAEGDSMSPTIQDGAPVVIDTSRHGQQLLSGKVYAIKIGDERMLKRLDRLPDGRIRVRSDNTRPEFAPFEVGENSLNIIGRAVWTPHEL